jgi:ATP-dependent DNA helicase RecG
MVDFQERPEAKTEKRWIDRLVPDGSWSGNVYDFFRKTYQKLTADLKVPFHLQDGQRVDDTPLHEALREALANTLIHADYSGRVSVLVVKRPDMFGFRNPGKMRIPLALAIQGGNSDCRNRRLQTMFQLVGYGDHAGSGLPKIYNNWAGQHWRKPLLYEMPEPEQTLMELRMSSLVPQEAIEALANELGTRFTSLTETPRLALITAQVEGLVSHDRLKQITTDHPADLTKLLGTLVRDGLLISKGTGRGMEYRLPWQRHNSTAAFEASDMGIITPDATNKPPELSPLTPELSPLTPELSPLTPELSSSTPELSGQSDKGSDEFSVIYDINQIAPEELTRLKILAAPVAERERATPELVQQTVLALCNRRYLGLRVLAQLLGRNPDGVDLRKRILNPLVLNKSLLRAYPNPNDPRQAYTAAEPQDKHL